MRIHLAADHAGYTLGQAILAQLTEAGHDVSYHGADAHDDGDDYPAFSIKAAQAVIDDEDSGLDVRGIIVGSSGAGESITANKVNGIRAVPGQSVEFVRLARSQADATIVTLGAALQDAAAALAIVDAFVSTPFEVDPDDVRRIIHTAEYENAGTIEGWMVE